MNDSPVMAVLVVEDNDDDRNLLSQILKRLESPIHRVESCSDGSTALEMLSTKRFDCMFLDYHLPDMNGMEVMIRAAEISPETAVVMITSQGSEELAVAAMKAGAFDYWVKGRFSKDSLERTFHTLRECLALRKKVESQEETLRVAERQRVMLESIGAACHHFSQPITSLLGRLEMLIARNPPLSESDKELLNDCLDCSQRMSDLIRQFQNVREYRTVPYIENYRILDIEDRKE